MASFVLASLSLGLSRFGDGSLATVWLPPACAAAFLLRIPLKNELPFFGALAFGIYCADLASGLSHFTSALFGLANMAEVAVMVALVRRYCGPQPSMTNINHLGFVVLFGALVAPLVSGAIALNAMALDLGLAGTSLVEQVSNWYLAHGLGITLLVPALLLLADLCRDRGNLEAWSFAEWLALLSLGLIASYLVFAQASAALLFLIPPITLLHAFRLGSLGTALFLAGLSAMAALITSSGIGPLFEASSSQAVRNHLLQAFIAANFLIGLPVAAALAGRKRIMDVVKNGRQQLAILANNISDAVLHYDLNGVCIYASPSVQSVMGKDPANVVGAHFTVGVHEDAREQILWVYDQLTSGASERERITYRRFLDSEDDTPVFIEASCSVVDNEGGAEKGIVVAARDVTERVELELLLTRARRHAENGARAKSEFLANMSHEIRTPMNGVLGFAELLLQSELDEDQKRQAQMIVQSGRSMMMLLNDVLDLSRIEAGQIAIDNTPVDLDATLAECAMLHQPNAEKKGLELVYEAPENLHAGQTAEAGTTHASNKTPWVVTDALRLRQIILNLIGNAVKFTETGRITVSFSQNENEFAIMVADTGIGIPKDRLATIFNPFTQAEGDTARRYGGTGLGLTISRQLAELLGGDIEVSSKEGEGSQFTLTLPAITVAPSGEPEPAREPDIFHEMPEEARILLAEDHDVNRMLAREMLERCGQSVAVAHDGNEAISMVMDSIMRGSPYDLVLMDMQMPGCDGYEATRAIRAEGITAEQLPIVALTANAFPEDVAAAKQAGMQAHLAKPMVFADLARVLQRWLPTKIVEPGGGVEVEASGPDHSEVIDLLHASRPENKADRASSGEPQTHSPALLKRWQTRRKEAVEAVRGAIDEGLLQGDMAAAEAREELARLVHKLAGTAAMFGEPELGDHASSFENSLRLNLDPKIQQALASELLAIAGSEEGSTAQQRAEGGEP
ncbi:ATP-binding protein [Erythrobacter sp. YT30]|uniref:ATP-binding protein n=1 Tax=Erythrobacter sp. YT30 TaxID=1735012 RepID=UPI001F25FD9D|nr:ATP-binding protein [Erythrobacter sp. YT30]